MSIASEITRITGNIADAYTACDNKGATMPVSQNSDNLATTIASIQTGSTPTLQTKNVTITENGSSSVTPDTGYDGLDAVNITTNVTFVRDIYKVNSIAERDALIGVDSGDMCVVFEEALVPYDTTNMQATWQFPQTIVLDTAITKNYFAEFRTGSGSNTTIKLSLKPTEFTVKYGIFNQSYAAYTSSDGLTYTRTSSDASKTFTKVPTVSTTPNEVMYPFILFLKDVLNGLYTYDGSSWAYSDIGIDTGADSIINGKKVYTNNGVISGTFLTASTIKPSIKSIEDFIPILTSTPITSTSSLYSGNLNSKILTAELIDTTGATSMSYMFRWCNNVESLDLRNFDTSLVRYMSCMFQFCYALKKLDISSFDFSNCTDLVCFIQNCSALEELILPTNVNTDNVTSVDYMCKDCTSLTNIDLSAFSFPAVTVFSQMFYGCTSLEEVNLSTATGSAASNISSMFHGCTSLNKLDIRSWVFKNDYTGESQFLTDVPNNCLIIVKDDTAKTWITSRYSNLTNVKTVAEL